MRLHQQRCQLSNRQRRIAEIVRHKVRFERTLARYVAAEFKTTAGLSVLAFKQDGEDGAIEVIRNRKAHLAIVLNIQLFRIASFFGAYVTFTKGSTDRAMRAFVNQHAVLKADDISGTTARRVRAAITQGVAQGLSVDDIAENIDDIIDDFPRAQMIARTEVNSVSNYSAQLIATQSGKPLTKEWGTAEDSHVRPTHAEADGQVRDLDEPFDVGGASLMFPGDPSGPAEEIINCRCVLLYEPKRP